MIVGIISNYKNTLDYSWNTVILKFVKNILALLPDSKGLPLLGDMLGHRFIINTE